MQRPSLQERFRYAFDNMMARGTPALVFWLAVVTTAMIAGHSALLLIFGLTPEDARGAGIEGGLRAFWYGLMRAMDAGTVSGDAGDWRWPLLVANLVITIGGIFILSTLISILSSGLQTRLEELRKGRSRVIETGHSVIIGWTDAIPTILGQLALATESQGRSVVVILAPGDKAEMDEAVATYMGEVRHLKVIVRSGNPANPADLLLTSYEQSRSVIVLHPGLGHDGDLKVMQTLMALFKNPTDKPLHVVTELHDEANREAALLVGRGQLQVVLGADVISRILVQACRQPGLSHVHAEILDFAGNEIYLADPGPAVGRTFGEALFAWNTSSVIGLLRDGRALLTPPSDTPVLSTDRVLLVAEDDSMIQAAPAPAWDESLLVAATRRVDEPERTLVLGWHARAARILRGLDTYATAGSVVCVVSPNVTEEEVQLAVGQLQRHALQVHQRDPSRRAVLDSLDLHNWTHVLVLPPPLDTPESSDSAVLLTLIHLRDIEARSGRPLSIVSEIMTLQNRELLDTGRADDFVVSNHLVSLMMCQMSESRALQPVLDELLDADGAEYHVRPADWYVKAGETVFSTVVESGRRRGEAVIGFRRGATGEVVINPPKSLRVTLSAEDSVVVVAHD
jgi:hypothetical protein